MPSLVNTVCAIITGRAEARSLGVDWTVDQWCGLVATARNHGVAGLLFRAFSTHGWPIAMPAEVRSELHAVVYEATGHSLRLYQSLVAMLATLSPQIPVIVLKGAAMAPYYHGLALRPISDLDLLIPLEMVPVATADLQRQLGYHVLPRLAPELAEATEPHVTLVDGHEHRVALDLHWALIAGHDDWRSVPTDWFWQQRERWTPPQAYLEAGGRTAGIDCLNPTASLLYQAAHLVVQHGHEPIRLIWIYDLHLLVEAGTIDWELLVAQAQALGWEAAVATALDEARRCFGTGLPAPVMAQLRRPLDRRVRYVGPEAPYVPLSSWDMLQRLRMTTRLHMLLRLAFPDPAYLRENYAAHWGIWWPFAYPYRWFKPLARLTRRMVRPNPTRSLWPR